MRSYSYVVGSIGAADGHYVELLETKFRELVRCALAHVEVDEVWYRDKYLDVHDAVETGKIKSARHHFIRDGYFEDRFPRPIKVDETWYLKQYPDVEKAVSQGAYKSGSQHFELDGYKEGRLPCEGWSLLGVETSKLLEAL